MLTPKLFPVTIILLSIVCMFNLCNLKIAHNSFECNLRILECVTQSQDCTNSQIAHNQEFITVINSWQNIYMCKWLDYLFTYHYCVIFLVCQFHLCMYVVAGNLIGKLGLYTVLSSISYLVGQCVIHYWCIEHSFFSWWHARIKWFFHCAQWQ